MSGMEARPVLKGRFYLITRRCSERRFFLAPDRIINNAFLYCLAVAAKASGMEVMFVLVMSNHYHMGIYDPNGNYPELLHWLHLVTAKVVNVYRGRSEAVWSNEEPSVVELTGTEDVLDKMIYTLTNPVKDHLVERAHHWPGFSTLECTLFGGVLKATRPSQYFSEDGELPEEATLELSPIPGMEHLTRQEFAELIRRKISAAEHAAAQERKRKGLRVLGVKAILEQNWWASPKTREPKNQLKPRVAGKNRWRRIEALQRNRDFLKAYKAAREALLAGVRDVIFPKGTYWLQHFAGVRCEPDTC